MTTVPKDSRPVPIQPPDVGKARELTGEGQVNAGPPVIGNSPPGAYQGDPVTAFGKGKTATPAPLNRPFTGK